MSSSAKQYVLALDVGTTSVRAVIFDKKLNVVSSAQKPLKVHLPESGWVEQDPQELWTASRYVMRQALKKKRLKPERIAGVGITNQRETTIIWDEAGTPIGPALVWQDRRTANGCDRMKKAGHEPMIRKRTGLLLDPYFSATKAQWLLKHHRPKKARTKLYFGTVDSWLIWNLTEGELHLTDPTNASRTMLFDLRQRQWDDELIRLFGLSELYFPEVKPTSGEFACMSKSVLGKTVPICGVCGDQQAALFGQTCFGKGEMKITFGTGAFLVLNTGVRPLFPKEPLVTTIAWQIGDEVHYALEGSVFNCGTVVNWLIDQLGVDGPKQADQLVVGLEEENGEYFVPALTGLGAPYWDPEARGAFFGLSNGSSQAHLLKAAWQGIAHQVTDVFEVMKQASGASPRVVKVDGGVSRSVPIMQAQADLVGVRVERPALVETTAVGVAMLAGLAVGFWKSEAALKRLVKTETKFESNMSLGERRNAREKWARAVDLSRQW